MRLNEARVRLRKKGYLLENRLSADIFKTAVDSPFTIDTSVGTFALILKQVIYKESHNTGPFHCFILIFTGPGEIFFHEGSYSLKHEKLGCHMIHIAPTGKTETGYRYQAIFTLAK